MSDIYNLQVKISKDTEKKLRKLADEDKRKLSSYVRVVLEKLVEGVEVDYLESGTNIQSLEKVAKSFNEKKESESDTVKKQIPTNQTENKIKITKSSKVNKFGGR